MAIVINLDSTLETASVSIAENGVILMQQTNKVQKEHATFLHSSIKNLLSQLNISINNVDAIATTIGPGSYTGLRVCLSAAKGLCYALNKPLITIGTLEALAKTAILHFSSEKDFLFCPMIDARRMEVYTAIYNKDLEEVVAPHAAIVDVHFCESLLSNKNILFFGSGMEKFQNINTNSNSAFQNTLEITNAINLLSYDKFCGEIFADIVTSSPLYTKEFHNL